jgi:hypothetical protein
MQLKDQELERSNNNKKITNFKGQHEHEHQELEKET